MLEQLILLGFGVAGICGFISAVSLFVWLWEQWDKHKEREALKYQVHKAPRRKGVEDYWNESA